ncbi:PoNe immunity protein domain-containing protein [Psychroflexus tropicus]|uniref:PoNe immunity protein domain-containing protein n=1 Tax=Psychroflexus tropicus TaxID=197345 RepID=UPI00037788D8|nr:PoNe immunity protein domain-containing protein [Psychroflexus tropicus]
MKNVKDNAFYEKIIEKYLDLVHRREFEITNFPPEEEWETRPHKMSSEYRLQQIKLVTFTARLQIIIASYSKGDDKNSLRNQFSEAVKVMQEVWDKRITKVYHGRQQVEYDQYNLNSYIQMLQMFSLAVLLDVPKHEFDILVNLVDRDGIKDKMIDFMILPRYPERSELKEESYQRYIMIPKLYKKLVNIAYDFQDEQAILETENFLKKEWIKIPKKYYINLNLKDISNYEVKSGFVGLWAFEVAAVVKIKGLDDSSFKDNRFYPDRLL